MSEGRKRYPVSVARERLADLLDAADAGETIVIERRQVEYTLTAAGRRVPARRPRRTLIVDADESVLGGDWSWTWSTRGLAFAPKRRRP